MGKGRLGLDNSVRMSTQSPASSSEEDIQVSSFPASLDSSHHPKTWCSGGSLPSAPFQSNGKGIQAQTAPISPANLSAYLDHLPDTAYWC